MRVRWLLPIALLSCRSPTMPAEAEQPSASAVEAVPTPVCASVDPHALAACASRERLTEDVRRVAVLRPPGSKGWRDVQMLVDETLTGLGFSVDRQRYATGVNVTGWRIGTQLPDEVVVVGAHYDHIPGCEGADDNATGVAGAMEVARLLASGEHARTLVVAFWDEEERGLVGSRAWVSDAKELGLQVAVYFNFDAIGYASAQPGSQRVPTGFDLVFPSEVDNLDARQRRADFIAFIADTPAVPWGEALAEHAAAQELPHVMLEISTLVKTLPLAVDLRRSDHAAFWDAGYPAVMITDTADFRSEAYHCYGKPDVVANLDLGFTTKVVAATAAAAAKALRPQGERDNAVFNR